MTIHNPQTQIRFGLEYRGEEADPDPIEVCPTCGAGAPCPECGGAGVDASTPSCPPCRSCRGTGAVAPEVDCPLCNHIVGCRP